MSNEQAQRIIESQARIEERLAAMHPRIEKLEAETASLSKFRWVLAGGLTLSGTAGGAALAEIFGKLTQ